MQLVGHPSYISEEGLEKLKAELQELKTKKRQEIAGRLQEAKALGDLAENSEYMEAKESQALNESRIMELEETIRNAVLIEKNGGKGGGVVEIGSTVEVESGHKKEEYMIVGSEEARPQEGRISNESPLGRAFLGRMPGDTVEAKTPSGVVKFKILKVK